MHTHKYLALLGIVPLLLGMTGCMGKVTKSSGKGWSNVSEEGWTSEYSAPEGGELLVENTGPGTLRGEVRSYRSGQPIENFRLVGAGHWQLDLVAGDCGSVSVFREGDAKTPVVITVTEPF